MFSCVLVIEREEQVLIHASNAYNSVAVNCVEINSENI